MSTKETKELSAGAKSLAARVGAAIDALQFSAAEMRGFGVKPALALLAGATIGYTLAIEDVKKLQEGEK